MNLVSFSDQVLKINLIGHRKRILASLGDRLHEDTPQKPPRAISLRVSLSACAHVEKTNCSFESVAVEQNQVLRSFCC